MNDVRISKFMSLVLRHDPGAAGLKLDANGWTDLAALCAEAEKRFGASQSDIRRIVAASDKQRFIIEGDRIRANQGHSVTVELGLIPVPPPALLYHGTIAAFSVPIELRRPNQGQSSSCAPFGRHTNSRTGCGSAHQTLADLHDRSRTNG